MGAGALITTRTAPNDFTRYTLTKLDERGLAASSVDFQLDFGSRGGPGASIQLASQGGRVRLFYANGGVGSVAFDPDGNRQASSDVQLIAGPTGAPSDEPLFAATITDSAMAVLWLRLRDPVAEGPFSVDVVLSTFAADGTPRGAPFVLGQQLDSRSVGSLRISGSGGRVLATWRDGAGDPTVHHAALDSNGSLLGAGHAILNGPVLQPVVAGDALYLCWVNPFAAGGVGMARLDANLQPVFSAGGDWSSEWVSPAWASGYPNDGLPVCHASDSRVALLGVESTILWSAWDNNAQVVGSLVDVWFDSPDAPPATATRKQRISRFAWSSVANPRSVVMDDRVLTVGAEPTGKTAVVLSWRPPR